ncbi:hypothetical protein [Caldalkalibacillus salinus]|uniref:hypothetical protein n=1 Tax=Caldalkalibacillus salinus TaxID=2803787 RepID=UPI001922B298|nr:hypothetical protein [Caldalkalibacillus salinus]
MRLWLHWVLFIVAWVLSTLSVHIWPSINDINSRIEENDLEANSLNQMDLEHKEDLFSIILYKPFHYILSIAFLIFFLLIATSILRKIVYECKVAYLFKSFPFETSFLFLGMCLLYVRVLAQFPTLTVTLTLMVAIFELISFLPQRKTRRVFVREG